MAVGLNEWYYTSGTIQYSPEGFVIPQYGMQGEKTLEFEVKDIYQD